jgi:hypothetical protein
MFSQSIERTYLDGNQQSSAHHRNWERLCKVRQTMRECRWNIRDLVQFWCTLETPEGVLNDPISKQRRRRDLAMAIAGQDGLLREVLAEAILEHREEVVNSIAEVLKGELDLLLSLKAFQEFSFSAFEEINFEEVPNNAAFRYNRKDRGPDFWYAQ